MNYSFILPSLLGTVSAHNANVETSYNSDPM